MKTAPVLIRLPDLNPSLDEEVASLSGPALESIVDTPADETKDAEEQDEPSSDQEGYRRSRRQRRESVATTSSWKTLAWQVTVGGLLIALFMIAYILLIGGRTPEGDPVDDNPAGLEINTGVPAQPVDPWTYDDQPASSPDDSPSTDDNTSNQPEKTSEGPDFTWEAPTDPPSRPNDETADHAKPAPSSAYTYPVTDPSKYRYPEMTPQDNPVMRTGRRDPDPNDGAHRGHNHNQPARTASLSGTIELPHSENRR